MDPKVFYELSLKKYAEQLKKASRQSSTISGFRLIAFVLTGTGAYFYFTQHQVGILLLTVLVLLIFLLLIGYSVLTADKKKLLTQLVFINKNELGMLDGQRNAFNNGAQITALPSHATDLDLFGDYSVYHLLNRTTTPHGANALAALLKNPLTNRNEILLLQEAIKALSAQIETRQLITANGLLQDVKDNTVEDILLWIDSSNKVSENRFLPVMRFAAPLLSVSGFIYYLSSDNPIPLGIGVIISWLIIGWFAKYIMRQHLLIGKKEAVLQQYGFILKTFSASKSGNSVLLKNVLDISLSARQEIHHLSKLSSLFDQRLNLLVSIFLNSLLLYDIQVMMALEKWKKRNKDYFLGWIEAVGSIEQLNSLATFSFNHPLYCFPELLEGRPEITAVGVGHPLIDQKDQVTNDIQAGQSDSLLLITGSNMSGKSTFLRTIGVNIVLAQCGLPVCAETFAFTPMSVLSSIRISDSLQENTSYFMAELKRLKSIIDALSAGLPALVLIDEVLRGTNSEDKKFGSEELIKKLSAFNCLAFFASHDLSLSVLEETLPGKVKNYCFESTIINGELLFDYKLHPGVATNKNASFLMKKMGIIGNNS